MKGTGPVTVKAFDAATGALMLTDSIRNAYFNNGTFQIAGLAAGDYNIEIRQYGACAGVQNVPISLSQPTEIKVFARNTYPSAPEYPDGEIELDSVAGGVKPYSISFGTGSLEPYTGAKWYNTLAPGNYELKVKDANNCLVTRILSVEKDSALSVPNVFTPNGDGANQVWIIKNLPINSKVTLSNRWGKVVYKATDYKNDWQAKDVEPGTYYYMLESPGGIVKRGWVEIIGK